MHAADVARVLVDSAPPPHVLRGVLADAQLGPRPRRLVVGFRAADARPVSVLVLRLASQSQHPRFCSSFAAGRHFGGDAGRARDHPPRAARALEERDHRARAKVEEHAAPEEERHAQGSRDRLEDDLDEGGRP